MQEECFGLFFLNEHVIFFIIIVAIIVAIVVIVIVCFLLLVVIALSASAAPPGCSELLQAAQRERETLGSSSMYSYLAAQLC